MAERIQGEVTAEEIAACTQAVWADERYERTFRGLVDMTTGHLKAKPVDVIAFTKFIVSSPQSIQGKVAILVREPRTTAMSFLMRSRLGMGNVAVFSTWAAALDYLSLPSSVLDELGWDVSP